MDEPGSGGANHLYNITGFNSASNPSDPWTKRHGQPTEHSTVLFQNGPINEVGVNGVTHEALLAILIDRMEGFQKGPYASTDNQEALEAMRVAQTALQRRCGSDRAAASYAGTDGAQCGRHAHGLNQMNTCGTCKYFGKVITGTFDEDVPIPGTHQANKIPNTKFHQCDLIIHLNEVMMHGKKLPLVAAGVTDASGYSATLCVSEEFGCNQWTLRQI